MTEDIPHVDLGRDLLEELDGENYARFRGEWATEDPFGWETFTVMLHGEEAGDITEATWEDLKRIVAEVLP